MIVRKATTADKVQIQTLMNELNLYRKSIFTPANQEFHARNKAYSSLEDVDFEESIIFVATDEADRIIGFIQGSLHQRKDHTLGKLGYIDELYVIAEARGTGAAQKLFSELEAEFKRQGCDHITTHTDFENDLSQQFYSQVGMNKVTVELWKKL